MTYCLNPDCQKPRNPDSAKVCRSCGGKLRLKDRYRATAAIGQGGFGRTFLAVDEDKPSKPRCVIKQFLPVAQTPQHLKKAATLFQQEAVRLEELGHHPQIPELMAYFSQDGQQYLVQEFIHGRNLADLLTEQGAFTETQIRAVLSSLLPVLDFVHSHNVIHRDIKPGNIISTTGNSMSLGLPLSGRPDWAGLQQAISVEAAQSFRNVISPAYRFSELLSFSLSQPCPELTVALRQRCHQVAAQFARYASLPVAQRHHLVADTSRLLFEIRQTYESQTGHVPMGRLVLVDFGAAKSLKGLAPLNTGTTIGSPEYVAPEQARGKAVFASDLYSLGVTCVHLLTQMSPYDLFDPHENAWIWRNYLPHPISDRLELLLDKLLEASIPRRFQSVTEVLQELEGQSTPTPVASSPVAAAPFSSAPIPPFSLVLESRPPRVAVSPSNPPGLQPSFSIARRVPGPVPGGGGSAAVQLADVVDSKPSGKRRSQSGWYCIHTRENLGRIYAIASGGSPPIVASSSGNAIKLWELDSLQRLRTLTGHLDIVPALTLSPDGKWLISGSADKLISLWEVSTGKRLANLAFHADTVLALAVSPNGEFLASSSFFDPITLYDLNTGQKLHGLLGHSARIDALAFSSVPLSSSLMSTPEAGYILASGSGDRTIKLWDVNTGVEIRTLEGHAHHISAIAFSPDGNTLASASWDGTVKLWNLKTRRHRTLEPESGRVNDLAFSADGKKLAIACDTLQLWPLPSGKRLMLDGAHSDGAHTDAVTAVQFGQSDQLLISAAGDRTIKLWQYSDGRTDQHKLDVSP